MNAPDLTLVSDDSIALADGFARRIGALSKRLQGKADNVRWAQRAAFAVSRATTQGHVCIALDALAQRYGETVGAVHAALLASGVACDGREAAADLLPLVIDSNRRIYLARYFDYERRLARALVERAQVFADAPDPAELKARVGRYFTESKDDGIDWQRVAALVALSGRLTIVSGGPGTGKTTTVVGVLACLLDENPALRIALAAPTGKAAQRMQEALVERANVLPPEMAARLPRTSFTLQRLLGTQANGRFRHHRDNPLPFDVIVIDEASMIDVALAAHLFEAVAPGARLVMLGDKDQLAAVEAGAVFAELSARPVFSDTGAARIAAALSMPKDRFIDALPNDRGGDAEADDQFAMLEIEPMWIDEPGYLIPGDGTDAYDALGDLPEVNWHPAAPVALDQAAISPLTDCVVWLQRNYRFGLDSDIGRLSVAIRRGSVDDALAALTPGSQDNPVRAALLIDDAGAYLSERTLARLNAGFEPYARTLAKTLAGTLVETLEAGTGAAALFDVLNRFRILAATRHGPRGVDEINARVSAWVRAAASVTLGAGAQWFAGRPVIVTRNDYALGVFNGDIGIALPAASGAMQVCFRMADGTLRMLSPAALPPHDTAFALTVHKSQGSEFEHAALVLPSAFGRMLSRELVYTAITRARSRIDVIGSADVFAQAVRTPTRRDSGLAARIAEAAL